MKKRMICICAILLMVLLLIVGISCCSGKSQGSGDGGKATVSATGPETDPSIPTAETTEPVTQPTGTEPPVIDPTEPEVMPSEPEIPETQPSEPETPGTDLVDPEIPEEKPSEPEVPAPKPSEPETSKPTEPPKTVEYIQGNGYKRVKDFDPATNTGETRWYLTGEGRFFIYEDEYIFQVYPGTLTYEMWCGWDTHTQVSFEMFCDWSDATIDDKYNFYRITENENYTCGWENHYCSGEDDHLSMLEEMSDGCRYCGTSECISFYARNVNGFTVTDSHICPEYDIKKDPIEYCQKCGLKFGTDGCYQSVTGRPCDICGAERKPLECHTCHKDNEE